MRKLSSVNIETIENVDINMSPLIDMVFLLLIFFMVTAVFVKETGVDINKPQAATASELDKHSVMFAVTDSGEIYYDKQPISPAGIRGIVTRRRNAGDRNVVILADDISRTGIVVEVIDQCKLAGAETISIATSESK